jgi:hypothetical protein
MDGSIRKKKWSSTLQVNAAGKWKVKSNSFDHGGVGVVWKRWVNSVWNFGDGIGGLKMGTKRFPQILYVYLRIWYAAFSVVFLLSLLMTRISLLWKKKLRKIFSTSGINLYVKREIIRGVDRLVNNFPFWRKQLSVTNKHPTKWHLTISSQTANWKNKF